jgi:hypothetical protein
MANGVIIWEGASEIDGAPIMVVATGIKAGSRNAKTGELVQTWILRSDMSPTEAVHSGADESICGACPHRGEIVDGKNVGRSCYVVYFQAPLSVYKTAVAGKYPRLSLEESREIFAGRNVRLGAYGDPGAVPFEVWAAVLADAARGTGYTHQWKAADSRFAQFCMASADNAQEAQEAQALGYRTFRVGTFAEKAARGEFLCPASEEAGKKLSCAQCLACGGTSSPNRASVFIPAHGPKAKVKAFAEWASQ